jgi:hypothetical protein
MLPLKDLFQTPWLRSSLEKFGHKTGSSSDRGSECECYKSPPPKKSKEKCIEARCEYNENQILAKHEIRQNNAFDTI